MTCCEELKKQTQSHAAFSGGGFLYPLGEQPTGQIERNPEDGSWNVNGCCGGGCYVLENIQFCPYCGTKLP